MKVIRSLLFYSMLFFTTLILGLAAIAFYGVTRSSKWSHLCARLWGKLNLWAAGVRVCVKGLEHLQPNQPFIYAANHQSWFDIFAIQGKLAVQFGWLAKEELFRIPVLGPAMAAAGHVRIDRSDRKKAFESINEAAMKVQNGTSIVIFPEGTRSPDGVLKDFKKGGFILAIKSQQPMVPISLSGSHRVLPKHGEWVIRPGVIHMTIGDPIPTAGCSIRDRDALMAVVRQAIRKHLTHREGGLLPDDALPDDLSSCHYEKRAS